MMTAMKKPSRQSDRGFTLLEMLIAVTLVAMMALSLWAVFRISIRSWSRGTDFIDTNQRHRSILDLVRKQMASTYGLIAPADPQQGLASRLIFSGTETSMRFISLNSLHFQDSPGLTLVIYEIVQDSNGAYSLVEKEARYLGHPGDQEASADQSKATPVFSNLISCVFEYFDPENRDTPWVREWDGVKLRRLPEAISVTMVSRDPRGNDLNRHMVVPIHSEVFDRQTSLINPFGARRAVVR
ncbi:MAG: prepilin-type N-terminal cleavage/methylation domain-containing protein [Acidobacteria bacterium]|nr:prepilin-type N-terminal cleavage/methylation domain-containing protein [Acidobacteriota bacterium]